MTAELEAWLSVTLVVLARVSAFVAMIPFLSSIRVPATIRAYIAIAFALALTPMVYATVAPALMPEAPASLMAMIASEAITGLWLGLMVRLFILAIQFAGECLGQVVGFNGILVSSVADGEATSPLSDVLSIFVAVSFFIFDVHLSVLTKLVQSYEFVPPAQFLKDLVSLPQIGNLASVAFSSALQLAAPFILYASICNLLTGLANRFVPQVPIQLVAAPAVLAGGLALAMLVVGDGVEQFIQTFLLWLSQGL